MKAWRLSLISAIFHRAMVVGGDWDFSAGFLGIVLSKRSRWGSVNVGVCVSVSKDQDQTARREKEEGHFIFVIVNICPWCSHITYTACDLSHEHMWNIEMDIF